MKFRKWLSLSLERRLVIISNAIHTKIIFNRKIS